MLFFFLDRLTHLCGAKTSEVNHLIDSGMPPFGGPLAWPQACIGNCNANLSLDLII
jgi:hypothetical protein